VNCRPRSRLAPMFRTAGRRAAAPRDAASAHRRDDLERPTAPPASRPHHPYRRRALLSADKNDAHPCTPGAAERVQLDSPSKPADIAPASRLHSENSPGQPRAAAPPMVLQVACPVTALSDKPASSSPSNSARVSATGARVRRSLLLAARVARRPSPRTPRRRNATPPSRCDASVLCKKRPKYLSRVAAPGRQFARKSIQAG